MAEEQAGSYWDAIRSWADSLGLLVPREPVDEDRPKVPQSVCDNCPICQGAATVEALNPAVLSELGELARTLVSGVGAALSLAAEQRIELGRAEAAEGAAATDDGADDAAKPDDANP